MQRASLWQNRDFVKLWAGETISLFGSLITRTALPFTAILVLDASPFQVALLAAADLVPGFLAGLVAGVWVDRLPRRPILIGTDLGRALLLTTVPVAAFFGLLSMEHLYLVAILAGLLTLLFNVAYPSYIPSLVARDDLVEANSKLAASASVAEVGAFSLGGWLVQLFTAPMAILIDAFSFLVSALFVAGIRTPEPAAAPNRREMAFRREIEEGIRALVSNPSLRDVAGAAILVDLSFRLSGSVYLLYVNQELGFEPGILGLIFALGGVSSLLGALVAGRATARLGLGRAMVVALAVASFGQLLVPLARDASLIAAALLIGQQLVADGAVTVFDINQMSYRQAVTIDRLLGRVNATVQFLSLSAMLAGTLIGGAMAEWLGLRAPLLAGVAVCLLAALMVMRSPSARLRGVGHEQQLPHVETGEDGD